MCKQWQTLQACTAFLQDPIVAVFFYLGVATLSVLTLGVGLCVLYFCLTAATSQPTEPQLLAGCLSSLLVLA